MNIVKESWVEKYRPIKLKDVVYQDNIIKTLQGFIKNKNMPHLLFYGPSGCGKTSTILALARELFTDKHMKDRIIELNASDERGIKTVREKIKRYAQNSINISLDIPPWKIIILDEADNMTSESQFALRKIMEDYSKVTRFCIICNYYNKIIEPIISRCSSLRFKPIPKDNVKIQLQHICDKEKINYDDKSLNKIIKLSRGDLRKSIGYIQRCKNFSNIISIDIIDDISGLIPEKQIKSFIKFCFDKNYIEMNKYIEYFYSNSYSLSINIPQINNIIMYMNKKDSIKSQIIKKLIEIDQCLLTNCDIYIEYYKLAYFISEIE
jgi:replication factor C subunit 2/4